MLTESYIPVLQDFLTHNNGKTGITFPSDREADLKITTALLKINSCKYNLKV